MTSFLRNVGSNLANRLLGSFRQGSNEYEYLKSLSETMVNYQEIHKEIRDLYKEYQNQVTAYNNPLGNQDLVKKAVTKLHKLQEVIDAQTRMLDRYRKLKDTFHRLMELLQDKSRLSSLIENQDNFKSHLLDYVQKNAHAHPWSEVLAKYGNNPEQISAQELLTDIVKSLKEKAEYSQKKLEDSLNHKIDPNALDAPEEEETFEDAQEPTTPDAQQDARTEQDQSKSPALQDGTSQN